MIDYVELHCHSHYSLLDGASSPEDLAACAAELGMGRWPSPTTTRSTACDTSCEPREVSWRSSHSGRRAHPAGGTSPDFAGGERSGLAQPVPTHQPRPAQGAQRAGESAPGRPGRPHRGLDRLSGCRRGEIAAALARDDQEAALATGSRYRDLLGPDHFWIELQHHLLPGDDRLVYESVDTGPAPGRGVRGDQQRALRGPRQAPPPGRALSAFAATPA